MENKYLQYVEKIKNSYEKKEVSKLEELRLLDKKVKKGPMVFSYTFGIIGSLVLGFGMCMAMEVILPGLMAIGIIIGLVGIAMVVANYFIFNKMLWNSKKKNAEKIIELSNEILNNEK